MYIPNIARFWGDKYGLYPLLCAFPGALLGFVNMVRSEENPVPVAPIVKVLIAIGAGVFFLIIWAFHFSHIEGLKAAFWFGVGFLVGFSHHHPIEYWLFALGYQLPITLLYLLAARQAEGKPHPMDDLMNDLERASREASSREADRTQKLPD